MVERKLVELTNEEMAHVAGGAITETTTTTNPQGHITQGTSGQAQTTTTVASNPAGHNPPGQQP
jgi:hypothetical protein